MQNIPPAQRRYVEKHVPRFARAVKIGRICPDVPVRTSIEEFVAEDMALVYASLWYAYSEGVAVTFAPPDKQRQ